MKIEDLEITYSVTDASAVLLTIGFGDRNAGGSFVWKDGLVVGKGDIVSLPLGVGLAGKHIVVNTVVGDMSDENNLTTVKYNLQGGIAPLKIVSNSFVETDREFMAFRAKISFI